MKLPPCRSQGRVYCTQSCLILLLQEVVFKTRTCDLYITRQQLYSCGKAPLHFQVLIVKKIKQKPTCSEFCSKSSYEDIQLSCYITKYCNSFRNKTIQPSLTYPISFDSIGPRLIYQNTPLGYFDLLRHTFFFFTKMLPSFFLFHYTLPSQNSQSLADFEISL